MVAYADIQKRYFAREKALYVKYRQIADTCKYLILQTSQRRYSVIQIKNKYTFAPVRHYFQKLHCIPICEVYASKLTYDEAVKCAIDLNKEVGINTVIDQSEFNLLSDKTA